MSKKRDWRKAEDYEDMKSFSLERWAWEFLRRSPVYIKEWDAIDNLPLPAVEKKMRLFGRGAKKWGLDYYINPNEDYPININFRPLGGEIVNPTDVAIETKGIVLTGPDSTGKVLYQFNIYNPITPQIAHAKKELEELQTKYHNPAITKKAFKPRTDEWITLIRVLDAVAAGASDREIEDVLFPEYRAERSDQRGIQLVFDKKRQAKKYLEGDYRKIPFMNRKTKSSK